jgi:hypothetical protein
MMMRKYVDVADSCDTHLQRLDDRSGFWILDLSIASSIQLLFNSNL